MRLVIAFALVTCAFAQSAPPEVDKALRERVKKFYQLHVEGKFRLVDPLIAEESKDEFYEMAKGKYLKFDDPVIEYSDNFTKAVVKTPVTQEWRYPRIGVMVVNPTVPSHWKIENGQWCFYIPKQGLQQMPWGVADLTKQNDDYKNGSGSRDIKRISPTEVIGAVNVDKQNISLSSYQDSKDEVVITNNMPGQVDIDVVYPPIKGLEVNLDKKVLQGGEAAKLSFKYTPPDPSPKPFADVSLQILQTNKILPLRITFAVPPDAPRPK